MGHKLIQIIPSCTFWDSPHELEAIRQLCDTVGALKSATDTKIDTRRFGAKLSRIRSVKEYLIESGLCS
jgi:hypothetical protein